MRSRRKAAFSLGKAMMVLLLASVTWCWAADLHAPATCVYDRQQCEEIVRLRHTGVCFPSDAQVRAFKLLWSATV
jgi:hypothetical protein